MISRPPFDAMTAVNLIRLLVFFTIIIFSLIVLGLSARFAEILIPSDLTRFVTVGLIVSITTLIITGSVFMLGLFRTYVYAAQTRVELSWLAVLSILWMALAIFLSTSADVEIDCSYGTGSLEENASVGMSSAEFDSEYRAIQACSFINAMLLVGWFLLLLASALAHHFSGHQQVWRTPVADYGWFDNPVGPKQRQKAVTTQRKGKSGGFSSSEEEIRGRSHSREKKLVDESVANKPPRSLPPVRPIYEPSRASLERPKPLRAVTQPITPAMPFVNRVIPPPSKPVPPIPSRPLGASRQPSKGAPSPSRPNPPKRVTSVPRPRQPTPPPPTTRPRVSSAMPNRDISRPTGATSSKPPLTRAQTAGAPVRPPAQPTATRSQTFWQPPPGTRERLAVPPPVIGREGLRARSRSRDRPKV